MTTAPAAVYAFDESGRQARGLARRLKLPCLKAHLHRFPDGESLVRIAGSADLAIVYRSLDRPNDKLIELMLAASALREAGATRLILVAPYLCYMRQDVAFHTGEAVAQRVVGQFLSELFDGVLTVDPHLHRVRRLSDVLPTACTKVLSAAPLLAERLRRDGVAPDVLLVGPDEESRQWVEAVAAPLGLAYLLAEKTRYGDRDVRISIPDIENAIGRPVILVDDLISTGTTLITCAEQLTVAGAASVEALAVHALFGVRQAEAMRGAGILRVRSTDSVPHASNAVPLAPLLAEELQGWLA